MATPSTFTTTPVSLVQRLVNAAWPYVGGPRGLIVLAIGVVVGGLALNWSWLVAAGVAPILLRGDRKASPMILRRQNA